MIWNLETIPTGDNNPSLIRILSANLALYEESAGRKNPWLLRLVHSVRIITTQEQYGMCIDSQSGFFNLRTTHFVIVMVSTDIIHPNRHKNRSTILIRAWTLNPFSNLFVHQWGGSTYDVRRLHQVDRWLLHLSRNFRQTYACEDWQQIVSPLSNWIPSIYRAYDINSWREKNKVRFCRGIKRPVFIMYSCAGVILATINCFTGKIKSSYLLPFLVGASFIGTTK